MRAREGMSPGVAARKRFGGVGFALGCGCKDPKAVAVAAAAVAASSPRSGTEASTATTATSRRAGTHPSGSASTGTLTVPSASSSFLWEDAEADGEEVEYKRVSSVTTPSFSGLLRELRDLEQSVKSSCATKSPGRNYFSRPPHPPPPPPPPLPPRPVHRQAVRSDAKASIKQDHENVSHPPPPPPPAPPLPSRPVPRRAVRGDDKPSSIKEGHGDFSPPRPRPPSLQVQTQQQHRRVKSVDKVSRQEVDPHFTAPLPPRPLPPPPPLEPLQHAKTEEDGANKKKEDSKRSSTPPKHRKAKSFDTANNTGLGGGGNRLDGSVAVVKQSEDPLRDFRRSMLNMIVENGIVAGDELRELLRRFLALNAPRHHDAILRAFAEIWDELFAAPATAPDAQHREQPPARQTAAPPRQRTPPRRRQQPLPAWRV